MTPPGLLVTVPPSFTPERAWTVRVLLGTVLGLRFRIGFGDGPGVRLTCDGEPGTLELADGLFSGPERNLLDAGSLPTLPVGQWRVTADLPGAALCEDDLPVLFGTAKEDGSWLSESSGSVLHLSADLIGGAFFLLSRLEEAISSHVDVHCRFPGTSSVAYRAGFLDRPIVNEYAEVLFQLMRRLWPRIERARQSYKLVLSHDVDLPFCRDGVPRRVLGDLLRRRDSGLAVRRALSTMRPERTDERSDVCFTFDMIMDEAEKAGVSTVFNFLAGGQGDPRNGRYSLSEPRVGWLMRRISARGHEIGLHPSYHTYEDADRTAWEFGSLRAAAARLGIVQERWGGRQHYLRWRNPITWQNWADAGLDYDSTLGFADTPGFRCGICVPFPVFNILARAELPLVERPLVVMDGTLLDYQKLRPEGALEAIEHLAQRCRRVSGHFTLLWHNDRLATGAGKRLFGSSLRVAG